MVATVVVLVIAIVGLLASFGRLGNVSDAPVLPTANPLADVTSSVGVPEPFPKTPPAKSTPPPTESPEWLKLALETSQGGTPRPSTVETPEPLPTFAKGTFVPVGESTGSRRSHTATRLLDGTVLVIGGRRSTPDGMEAGEDAEVYDPRTGTFSLAGKLIRGRYDHTATLLLDGKVLVSGGYNKVDGELRVAELYDPETRTFSITAGKMTAPRAGHQAIRLPSGEVLLLGRSSIYVEQVPPELYDPSTGFFSSTGTMAKSRVSFTATLLPDGKVLVAGGHENKTVRAALKDVEIFDATTRRFSQGKNLASPRSYHTATLLPDSRILLIGNLDVHASVYDPTSKGVDDHIREVAGSQMVWPRSSSAATLLRDGRVLVSGGRISRSKHAPPEMYNPAGEEPEFIELASDMVTPRDGHTATLLDDGAVLFVGGNAEGTPYAELFVP